jgi:hypothetical protein
MKTEDYQNKEDEKKDNWSYHYISLLNLHWLIDWLMLWFNIRFV